MRIQRILYPTDFSDTARQALTHALFLAEQFDARLEMLHAVVLHDYDPGDPGHHFPEPTDILERLYSIADSEMAQLTRDHKKPGVEIHEAKRRGFSASEVVLDYAAEIDADLIVMGTHGRRGAARLLLGSVAEGVVRSARCPVMTLRKQDPPRTIEAIERILVPIDFSDSSRLALDYAKDLARTYGAGLRLLHTIEEPSYPYFYAPIGGYPVANQLEALRDRSIEALERLASEAVGDKVSTECLVTSGHASSEIVRIAKEQEVDLLVIATHGLSRIERLLMGSTSEQVVRTAPCPVFTVKPFGKSLISKAVA